MFFKAGELLERSLGQLIQWVADVIGNFIFPPEPVPVRVRPNRADKRRR